MEQLQYPIGNFVLPETYTKEAISVWVNEISALPDEFISHANSLSEKQLDTPYRPDGWTGRQVIHHVADSHMNALIRVKLALTEDTPMVKPYVEALWSEQVDYKMPIESSLAMIRGIHAHLSELFKHMTDEDYLREFTHPQYNYTRPIAYLCALYAWHGKHHLAHLKLLLV